MKKLLLSLIAALLAISAVYSQSGAPSPGKVFYYYKGEKLFFNVSYKKIVVGIAEGHSINEIKALLTTTAKISNDSVSATPVKNQYLIKLAENKARESGKQIVADLIKQKIVLYARPAISGIGGKLSSYGNNFIVKLKPSTSSLQLTNLLNKYNCTIDHPYKFDKSTFILSAGPANKYDGLTMANVFYESGIFEYAEPDLTIYDAIDAPPNDPLYSLQWNLKNTGSSAQYNGVPGADMDVLKAWKITKGKPSIKIAVIDEGVDTGHADLKANLLQGFNCLTQTSNTGDGRPLSSNNAHGTCCAGIIAAVSNNGIGVSGVANKCKIIPINLADANGIYTSYSNIAGGFDYAWMNGADVLSNSWGGGTPSSILDDAIHRAITQGRDGKGCVVFFSAGNNYSGLSYPALNKDVIAVGGISMCNQRKSPSSCDGEYWWGASYGDGLGLVAPCVKIPTTDISGTGGYSSNDYYNTFNGTSSACPNAAAVAALVLSVSPSLKQEDVETILETTADKIPGYSFKSTTGYKNGTWNNELGYGRVNAYQAVLAAQNDSFCNVEIVPIGASRICKGDSSSLQVVKPDNSAVYQWYKNSNGNQVATNATSITVKQSGNYYVVATYPNSCIATSAKITVTSVEAASPLLADAGKDISLCVGSNGARIGGLPSASNGVAFLSDKRGYAMDWFTNNFYKFNLSNPSDVDKISSHMVSNGDLSSGYFFTGGDFTPYGYYALTQITNKLFRIDTLNGQKQLVKTIAPSYGSWQGLAWDPQGEQLYAMSSFGTYTQLYKVDFITGKLDFVTNIQSSYLIWITFDNAGNLYGLSTYYDKILKINKTNGSVTYLPSVADNGLNYAQDADFDPVTDSLYLTAYTAHQNQTGDLRIANTTYGTLNVVGTLNNTPYNEFDATAIGGYTYKYNWSPATGLSNPNDANPFANPAQNTTYTLTVTDLCGNQATSKIKVVVGASEPTVTISAPTDTICNGEKITLTATDNNNYLYQWYRYNKPIDGATNNTYKTKKKGSYTVKVSMGVGGCSNTSAPYVLYKCNEAISGFTNNISDNKMSGAGIFTLFPNPATNMVTLNLSQSMKPSTITVYDVAGKAVLIKQLKSNNSKEQINISRLAAGSYRIVWQQDQQQHTFTFVKL